VGHAYRFVSIAFTLAGAAGLIHWWLLVEHSATLTAPLVESGEPDARSVAEYPAAGGTGPLRIAYIGTEPYSDTNRFDRLSIAEANTEHTADLIPGGTIDIDAEKFVVQAVRVWQGLLPVADGVPMASVSVFTGSDPVLENLLLSIGSRFDFPGDMSVELVPCSDSGDTSASGVQAPVGSGRGRWGVVDGSGVLWFDGFVPGSGATLTDGSVVTLESYTADGPSLVIRKQGANGVERITLDAPSNRPPIFFDPGPSWASARLMVCDDGMAKIGESPTATLSAGDVWPFSDGRHSLRLEQALLSAAPVAAKDSPFFEAVLESPHRRVRVRQGEAVRVGESMLRYQRAGDNSTATVRIRVVQPGVAAVDVALRPDERYFFKWKGALWSVAHDGVRPGTSVTLEPQPESRWPLYASIASFTLGLAMLLPRRARRGR